MLFARAIHINAGCSSANDFLIECVRDFAQKD